ncbi:MAG TPA: ThuA domain-containing protein [Burkholderiales bacterium]|nr:ThuA domain-containing protein [Burkholderiales bacterium]
MNAALQRRQFVKLGGSVAIGLLLSILGPGVAGAQSAEPDFAVLVFSKTAGYRHDSIPNGIAAIRALGEQNDFRVDASEDAALFNDGNLAQYRVVVFLSTSGDIFDSEQQAALQKFVQRGGGFVGIHSATDTEYDWPWYDGLVGNYFRRHPVIQSATLKVVDPSHRSTRHLPIEWKRTDEWYDFRHDLDADFTVLMRIDETTYRGGRMGADHPMAWYHAYDGGRAWYTALGHTAESYKEPLFLEHVLGGIIWAAGNMPSK